MQSNIQRNIGFVASSLRIIQIDALCVNCEKYLIFGAFCTNVNFLWRKEIRAENEFAILRKVKEKRVNETGKIVAAIWTNAISVNQTFYLASFFQVGAFTKHPEKKASICDSGSSKCRIQFNLVVVITPFILLRGELSPI